MEVVASLICSEDLSFDPLEKGGASSDETDGTDFWERIKGSKESTLASTGDGYISSQATSLSDNPFDFASSLLACPALQPSHTDSTIALSGIVTINIAFNAVLESFRVIPKALDLAFLKSFQAKLGEDALISWSAALQEIIGAGSGAINQVRLGWDHSSSESNHSEYKLLHLLL